MELNKTTFNFNTYSMRKFYNLFKGRKKYAFLTFLSCILLGIGSAKAADSEILLGTTLTPSYADNLSFTAPSAGDLVMTVLNGRTMNVEGMANINPTSPTGDEIHYATSATWSLDANAKLTIKWPDEGISVSFSFSGGGDSGNGDNNGDNEGDNGGNGNDNNNEKSEDLVLNESFKPMGDTVYYFTPTSNGILKWVDSSEQPQIYYVTNSAAFLKDPNDNPVIPIINEEDIYGDILAGMIPVKSVSYFLIKGITYKFEWEQNSGGTADKSLTFTFTPQTTDVEEMDWSELEMNKLYYLAPFKLTYTPSEDGTLKAKQWGSRDGENGPWLSDCPFLFEDEECTIPAQFSQTYRENPNVLNYYLFKNTKYYFKSYDVNSVEFDWITFVEGGSGELPNDIDSRYEPVVLGNIYDLEDYPNNELRLFIFSNSGGLLTIKQKGSTDPHLWTEVNETPEDYTGKVDEESNNNIDDYTVFTYRIEPDKVYYFYGIYDKSHYLELKKVIFEFTGQLVKDDPDITVNIGNFQEKAYLWNKNGMDYTGVINYTYGDDAQLIIRITPTSKVNTKTKPSVWSENAGIPDFLWNQKEAIKASKHDVDGYYSAPRIITNRQNEITGNIELIVVYGCSGEYNIEVSSRNPNVVFEGETMQTVKVYPNLKNWYSYTLEGEEYDSDRLTINGYTFEAADGDPMLQSGPWKLNYPSDSDKDMSKAKMYIPGVYFADVYYSYESKTPYVATQASNEKKLGSDGTADLSGLDLTSNNAQNVQLRLVKNGADTADLKRDQNDYMVAVTPNGGIFITPTGVDGIEAENESSVVEFYNLNGIKVNPENLEKGIYIVKKGNETYKMVKN